MNRTEFKKISYGFNSISNRLLQAEYNDYQGILKKFLNYIDTTELIKSYIDSCGEYNAEYEEAAQKVMTSFDVTFVFGDTDEEEINSVYSLLKYLSNKYDNMPVGILLAYSSSKDSTSERLKKFNQRIVMILMRHIEDYLTEVGIDMGLDEKNEYNINIQNGQVNISKDNSTINAVQNISVSNDELKRLVLELRNAIDGNLSADKKEAANDSIDIIENELLSNQPNEKNVKSQFRFLKTIDNGIKFTSACCSLLTFADKIYPFLSQLVPLFSEL